MKTVDIGKYNTMAAFGAILSLLGLLDSKSDPLSQNQPSLLFYIIGFILFSVAMYKYSKIFQNSHIMKNYLIAVGLFLVAGFFFGLLLATVIDSGYNTPENLINLIINICMVGMSITLTIALFFMKNTLLELYKHLKHRLLKIVSWIYFVVGVISVNLLSMNVISENNSTMLDNNSNDDILSVFAKLAFIIIYILLAIAFVTAPSLVEVPE